MTSIQFVVHPLPGTQEQLQEKLREVADRLNKYNTSGTPPSYGSGLDPDPDWIRIQGKAQQIQHLRYRTSPRIFNYPDPDRIRIGSGLNRVSGSGSKRAKMTHKIEISSEISWFEVLDVLIWGLASFLLLYGGLGDKE
jgi:hypothetical protein